MDSDEAVQRHSAVVDNVKGLIKSQSYLHKYIHYG